MSSFCSSKDPTIPNHLISHFVDLVLQKAAEKNKVIEEEEDEEEQEEEDEEEEEEEDLDIDEEEENVEDEYGLHRLSRLHSRTGVEVFEKPPKKLEISHKGKPHSEEKEVQTREPTSSNTVTTALHRRWSRTIWRQEINNLEPVYRLPVLILRQFRYIKSIEPGSLGPGTYDIDYYEIQKKKKLKTTRGILNTCGERFPKEREEAHPIPGPGTYGNPYETYEKATEHCKNPSRVPFLEWGPCNVRTVMSVTNRNPGPGKYNFKSGMQLLAEKVTSTRGPYDLYTPSRSVIPYGYYKTMDKEDGLGLGPGQYNISQSIKQELNNCCNDFKGRIPKLTLGHKLTGERVSVMQPLWPTAEAIQRPGPAHYTLEPFEKDRIQIKPPFHISSPARQYEVFNYDMSPDKYQIKDTKQIVGDGWKSAFISKSNRLDLLKIRVLTERIRGKDIPCFRREGYKEGYQPKDISKIHCSLPPSNYYTQRTNLNNCRI